MRIAMLLLFIFIRSAPSVEVRVAESGFAINGVPVVFPLPSDDLKAIIGQPDRTSNLASKIYTWDSLGITAYVKGGSPEVVTEVQLITQNEPFPFSPKERFTGTIDLLGTPYRHDLSGDELIALGFEAKRFVETVRYLYRSKTVYCNIDTVNRRIGWSHVTISNP